jgi:proline dehydrogenase
VSLNGIARRSILGAAHNPATERFVSRYGMRLGAARFVAGETLDECVEVLRSLNAAGFRVNTTVLGETVTSLDDSQRVLQEYQTVLQRLADEHLQANVSLKLTHLGLDLGVATAEANLATLLSMAVRSQLFIRIDMEDSRYIESTLAIYRSMRERGFDNVGAVLQAYLYRSRADLESLLPLRPNLRLVKGAYLERPEVAYPKKTDVDRNYVELIERSLLGGAYTAVATHDDRVIEHVVGLCRRHGISPNRFEIQMLYGVRPQLQKDLVGRGFQVLIAAPFGPQWYPYLMRRMAERPANLFFFLRNLVRR